MRIESLLAGLLFSASVFAQATLTEGEVRNIDAESSRLTLRHGEIRNLDMPPMTMVFQVKDRAQLSAIRAGDKVRFSAEKVDGKYVITHIETAR